MTGSSFGKSVPSTPRAIARSAFLGVEEDLRSSTSAARIPASTQTRTQGFERLVFFFGAAAGGRAALCGGAATGGAIGAGPLVGAAPAGGAVAAFAGAPTGTDGVRAEAVGAPPARGVLVAHQSDVARSPRTSAAPAAMSARIAGLTE